MKKLFLANTAAIVLAMFGLAFVIWGAINFYLVEEIAFGFVVAAFIAFAAACGLANYVQSLKQEAITNGTLLAEGDIVNKARTRFLPLKMSDYNLTNLQGLLIGSWSFCSVGSFTVNGFSLSSFLSVAVILLFWYSYYGAFLGRIAALNKQIDDGLRLPSGHRLRVLGDGSTEIEVNILGSSETVLMEDDSELRQRLLAIKQAQVGVKREDVETRILKAVTA